MSGADRATPVPPADEPAALWGTCKAGGHAPIAIRPTSTFAPDVVVRVTHTLATHPMLTLDSLARLAQKLRPTGQCRFTVPGTTFTSDFWHEPESPDGRQLDEVFARIEEPGSWLALYYVNTDPTYGRLLEDILDTMRPLIEPKHGRAFCVQGYIFVSTPPAVTPFHIDRENNFWLQVRGHKRMYVWDPADRTVVSDRAIEDFIVYRSLDHVKLDERYVTLALAMDMHAGDGVYMPSTTPHMVKTVSGGGMPVQDVSISLALTFYTERTRQVAGVLQLNRVLRRVGFDPAPPGHGALRDEIKAHVGRTVARLSARLRGYDPPPGLM